MEPIVVAVSRDPAHSFSKANCGKIRLLVGLGVEGDAHLGEKVQHRSRVAVDPNQPNLRQAHLLGAELLDELAAAGSAVAPGQLGENITTRGIDLLALPAGTKLSIGESAVIQVTGFRNPCVQIDQFQPGLLAAVARRGPGVMGIVLAEGEISPGDAILVELPPEPHKALGRV